MLRTAAPYRPPTLKEQGLYPLFFAAQVVRAFKERSEYEAVAYAHEYSRGGVTAYLAPNDLRLAAYPHAPVLVRRLGEVHNPAEPPAPGRAGDTVVALASPGPGDPPLVLGSIYSDVPKDQRGYAPIPPFLQEKDDYGVVHNYWEHIEKAYEAGGPPGAAAIGYRFRRRVRPGARSLEDPDAEYRLAWKEHSFLRFADPADDEKKLRFEVRTYQGQHLTIDTEGDAITLENRESGRFGGGPQLGRVQRVVLDLKGGTLTVEQSDQEGNLHRVRMDLPGRRVELLAKDQQTTQTLRLDHGQQQLALENASPSDTQRARLDAAAQTLTVESLQGDVKVKGGGGKAQMELLRDGRVRLEGLTGVDINSPADVRISTPATVHVDGGTVMLAGGGPPVARVGDLVRVGGLVGVIISGSSTTFSS